MQRWNLCEKVLNVNTVGNLGLKWSFTALDYVFSSPAVVSGVVYVGSGSDNNVYALNATTGGLSCGASPPAAVVACVARRGEWGGLCRVITAAATCTR